MAPPARELTTATHLALRKGQLAAVVGFTVKQPTNTLRPERLAAAGIIPDGEAVAAWCNEGNPNEVFCK
jgi:hypothetical protein